MQASRGRNDGGPPPAKRVKGNPIITRYPPPPGYVGPGWQPPPFQQQPTWPAPGQPAPFGNPPTFSVQSPQDQSSPQAFQPPQWSFPQHPQSATGLSPPNYFPPYPQPHPPPIQTYPPAQQQPSWQYPPSASTLSNTPASLPTPHPWSASTDSQHTGHRRRQSSSITPATENSLSAYPLDGNGDPMQPPSSNKEEDEDEFFGECYYSRNPDEVDPNLSLGLIEWKPPLPTKRALPATFNEAELEAVAPRSAPPNDEESVSEYFFQAKRHEALLSVRQTALWEEVRHDLIFRDFSTPPTVILTLPELIETYRDRHDASWMASETYSSAEPTPEPEEDRSRGRRQKTDGYDSEAMDLDDRPSRRPSSAAIASDRGDSQRPVSQPSGSNQTTAPAGSRKRKHSRASSTSSIPGGGQRYTRPKAHVPVRNQQQEDVLAALGVTGSPKTVYETPGPAFGAAPPPQQQQREGSAAPPSRRNTISPHVAAWSVPPPPPPPPPPSHPTNHPYAGFAAQQGHSHPHPSEILRPGSSHSAGTAVGSDFQFDNDDDPEPTPKASRTLGNNRKRSLEDIAEVSSPVTSRNDSKGDGEEGDRDATPKPRRKAPRVQDAYRRRW